MKWFPLRQSAGESLAVSMAGITLGNRLLVVGCDDALLIAQLAVKTGLTGRAYAMDAREPVVVRAARIAEREGALIETAAAPWSAIPVEADAFDVAVVRDVFPSLAPDLRGACAAEVRRVLRPGGRCLVIDAIPRGLRGLLHSGADPADDAVQVLTAQGFKAARVLARRDGVGFAEAAKQSLIPNH